MSLASKAFDIAEVKRASVRFKGALQAEWQEAIEAAKDGQTLAPTASTAARTQNEASLSAANRALPTLNLGLKYSNHNSGSHVLENLSPLKVSNWAC